MVKSVSPDLLVRAYASGYFPMPNPETEEIEWYRPDPRAILPHDRFYCSRSLRRVLKQEKFKVSFDKAFSEVIQACANREDTWINKAFISLYTQMFHAGFAHSVEVWNQERLVGGLYGVSIRGAFFGESQFHRESEASKVALYHLIEHLKQKHFVLHEVQFITPHLESLGAITIPDDEYMQLLNKALQAPTSF